MSGRNGGEVVRHAQLLRLLLKAAKEEEEKKELLEVNNDYVLE